MKNFYLMNHKKFSMKKIIEWWLIWKILLIPLFLHYFYIVHLFLKTIELAFKKTSLVAIVTNASISTIILEKINKETSALVHQFTQIHQYILYRVLIINTVIKPFVLYSVIKPFVLYSQFELWSDDRVKFWKDFRYFWI